jgi:alkanesulfonate monooxygenase SsuD/methylene tetrahydromethanopterin reductase-like flavin-dependent oxidoreductase (luciferase family)
MLGLNVFAADTDEEARLIASSQQQAFVNLRTGRPGPLPPPVEHYYERLDPTLRGMLDEYLSCAVIGGPDQVREGLEAFIARTGADELMITANVFDFDARLKSYTIAAAARQSLPSRRNGVSLAS